MEEILEFVQITTLFRRSATFEVSGCHYWTRYMVYVQELAIIAFMV